MNELEHCTELLSRLVACPSVNPNRKPVSGPPFGEERIVSLLDYLLRSWGAKTRVEEVAPGRPNLIATFEAAKSGRSLMLEAHSDTVQVDQMTIAPFEPAVKNGRLYGRGACDTKGAIAAMLAAIEKVLDEDGQLPMTLHFVSCCNEELGATGAHGLMKAGFRADFAVVGEPTDLRIVHAHKGVVRLRITTSGVAAHSSDPSRGVNAIYKMVPVLEALERKVQPELQKLNHPQLGRPTLSVGTIHGGTQVNVVPPSCAVEVDRRFVPGETRDSVVRQIVDALRAAGDPAWEEIEYYPPLEQDPASPIAKCVREACEEKLGKAEFVVAPWGSDAGVFSAAGIPSVLFGPGSIQQAHTQDEYVELDQVVAASRVYAEIIRECGAAAGR